MTACMEFYQRRDEVARKISDNMQKVDWTEYQFAPPNRINFGPPWLLNSRTAHDWLFLSYSIPVNLLPRMPPATGEVCVFLSDSTIEGKNGVIIPKKCLEYVQEVMSSLRGTESKFNGNNGNSLYRHMSDREKGFRVSETANTLIEKCENDSDLIPRNGIWEIRSPSPVVQNCFDEDGMRNGMVYRKSAHSHVGNVDWTYAILTGGDFEAIATQNEDIANRTIYREDVMHIPLSVLMALQKSLENGGAESGKYGIVKMLEKDGFLDETLETDLLGISFAWNLPRRKLVVRPIISELHYERVKGKVPVGVRMDMKGCYVDVNTDFPDQLEHRPVLVDARSYIAQCAR